MKKRLIGAAAIVAALLLLLYLTILFIPNGSLKALVVRVLAANGYSFAAGSFSKSFPLGLEAENVVIGIDEGPVVRVDETKLHLRVLPLLLGRVTISGTARIGQGVVAMKYAVSPHRTATVSIDDVLLQDIPFFQTFAAMNAKGTLRGTASLSGLGKMPEGTMQLEVRGAELANVNIGGTPLPDAAYSAIQGKLSINRGKAKLESFTLQGEGLYVRFKGEMPVTNPLSAAPLNMSLELMPKPEFLEKQKFVFLLLTKYLDTPGHYLIPVRGTLGKPSVL